MRQVTVTIPDEYYDNLIAFLKPIPKYLQTLSVVEGIGGLLFSTGLKILCCILGYQLKAGQLALKGF